MPKPCGRIVDGSYSFFVPHSCAGGWTVAKALRAKAVRAYWTVAKACAPKLCSVERTGQEAAAKIAIILALRR